MLLESFDAPNVTLDPTVTSLSTYYSNITSNITPDLNALSNIDNKNTNLLKKEEIQLELLKDIEDTEKILLTRSRMLQISTDRNSYKLKIIYLLISIAILIFIINIAIFIFLRKK
jgi:hypothetical protein